MEKKPERKNLEEPREKKQEKNNKRKDSWEDKHFLYHRKKLMQQKNINIKEILQFTIILFIS